MKNKLIIAIVSGFFINCSNKETVNNNFNKKEKYIESIYINSKQQVPIYIYEIDSCEYIGKIDNYSDQFITHKGDCKFCKTRNK